MGRLFNDISNYIPFGKSVIQRRMSYKVGFFMRIVGGLIQVLIMYYLWVAIFNSSSSSIINGFNSSEIIVYVIMSYITSQIINVSMDWTISDDIITGSIATNLIKPISYEKRILSESIGQVVLNLSTISLPLWICFYIYKFISEGQMPPDIINILLYILSVILGYVVMFLFNFIFSISAFFVTYIWGFMMAKGILIKFFSGELIPIVFFPVALQGVLKYLPFSAMNYTPVMVYMGKLPQNELLFSLGIQLVWIIVLYIIFRLLWKKAIERVTVMGG
ncbi:MAG: hypothetical protein GX275_13250 [Clostridiales bacterium]|nr:hypothetical protein [Clostridiales bacterium]